MGGYQVQLSRSPQPQPVAGVCQLFDLGDATFKHLPHIVGIFDWLFHQYAPLPLPQGGVNFDAVGVRKFRCQFRTFAFGKVQQNQLPSFRRRGTIDARQTPHAVFLDSRTCPP